MGRIFSVRINLDDMAAGLDAFHSSDELADWVRGFRTGSRGAPSKPGWTEAMLCGHAFGLQAHEGARAFSAKQSAKGKLRHSHGSATAEPRLSQTSAISNNPIIQLTNDLLNEGATAVAQKDIFEGMEKDRVEVERFPKEETPSKRRPKVFAPPTIEEVAAYCAERQNTIDAEHFVAYYEARGWMLGKDKMSSWKGAIVTWEKNEARRGVAPGVPINPHPPESEAWYDWNAAHAV